jgi:hypothetical protein
MVLAGIEAHISRELRIQKSEAERIGIFKEAAREVCAALEQTAPFLATIFHEYEVYMTSLEATNKEMHAARRDRDNWKQRFELQVLAAEARERELLEAAKQEIAKIDSRLRGATSASTLIKQIEKLEQLLADERNQVMQLRSTLEAVHVVKADFKNAVHFIEQAFQAIAHEREVELAQRQMECSRLLRDALSQRDAARQQLLDAQMAKDAMEILLTNAQQREQQLALRTDGLELRNSALAVKAKSRAGVVDDSSRLLTPRPSHAAARGRVPELGAAVDGATTEGLLEALLDRVDDFRAKLSDAVEANRDMEARVLGRLRAQITVDSVCVPPCGPALQEPVNLSEAGGRV